MKRPALYFIFIFLLPIMQISAQLLIDAEDASFDSKKYLVDNGNTYKLSRDGMINETGSIWDQDLYNSNDCFISSEESRAGSHSIAYYIEATTSDKEKQRIEHYYQQEYDYHNGLEHYTAFSIRLDGDAWDNPTEWFNIHQMMQQPGGRAPVLLHIDDDGSNRLRMRFYHGPNSGGRIGTTFDVKQLEKDIWYDLIVGYKWSPNSTDGFMYVWVKTENETTYARTGVSNTRVGYANQPQQSWFSTVGIYRSKTNNTNRLYIDELKFSNDIEDVKIPGSIISEAPPVYIPTDAEVSFETPSNGQTFDAPANVTVRVNASGGHGGIANVKLYLNDTTFIRQESVPPYEWNGQYIIDPLLNDLAAGIYTLKAVITDKEENTAEETISVTVTPSAGINALYSQNSLGNATVYPNPFSSQVTIDLNNASIKRVNVLDVKGTIIYQNNQLDNKSTLDISMNEYGIQKGIYFLQLINENEVKTIKLIRN